MTLFSALLSHFIQLRKTPVFSLTQYCSLDRSTMYKYISGKRLPPRKELVEQISDCLRLSPSERQRLLSAWEIVQVGEETYHCRKSVEEFILNFPDIPETNLPGAPFPSDHSASTPSSWNSMVIGVKGLQNNCIALSSQAAVNHAVNHIILNEAKKENGQLLLLLQPDYEYLLHFLTILGESGSTLHIEHIFCLNSSLRTHKSQTPLNLLYLRNILPLYIRALDYTIYYYRGSVESHFSRFSGFSCMILTDESAIICTSDYSNGIFYSHPETIRLLQEQFFTHRKECLPLFRAVNALSLSKELDIFNSLEQSTQDSYVIQSEPCLIPFITPDLVKKYLHPDLFGRDALIPVLNDFLTHQRKRICNSRLHVYQTLSGIHSFLQTGQIYEIPEGICLPFSSDDRKLLITQLLQNTDNKYRLLSGPLQNLPKNFHLYVSSAGGYLLFTNRLNRMVYLLFQDPGLLDLFLDYFSHLDAKYLFPYSQMQFLLQELLQEGESQS